MFSLTSRLHSHWFITLIVAGYLLVGALYAVFTPGWQAPDEPAHYNYVAQVARSGCCPKIEPGDWDQAYLEQLKNTRFHPETLSQLDTIQYEDHQPPLFYLLAAPVYQLSAGSLTALRLFSVVMGSGVVVCVYAVGRTLLPERPHVALGAGALAAFLPQNLAIMASVNNDSLANSLTALALLLSIFYLQEHGVRVWWLGLLVGLGLLTKLSTLFLVGLVPLVILMRWWRGDRHVAALVRELAEFAVPAAILSGVWIVRNIGVYGFPDVFGLRQHNLVVADQLRTADLIAQMGFGAYLNMALDVTFTSFWGQFGWMALPLPDWIRLPLLGLLTAGLVGLGLNAALRSNSASKEAARGPAGWIMLTVTLILAVLAYLYYNTEFVQFQGRYMYAGLLPFVLFMALGLEGWRRALTKWLPVTRAVLRPWVIILPFLAFAALDVYLLFRVIVPGLTPGGN